MASIGQLKCINRKCKNGNDLVKALGFVSSYYQIKFNEKNEVCGECFKICVNHFKQLQTKWENDECILKNDFPSYSSYIVIESSSSEDEDESKTEGDLCTNIPKKIRNIVPKDKDLLKYANLGFDYLFDKNKEKIDKHIELCNNEIEESVQNCIIGAKLIDDEADFLEKELESIRTALYEPYTPTLEVEEIVDIEESDGNVRVKHNKQTNCNQESEINKNNISHNSGTMVYTAPANLPLEGPLKYPTLQKGQQMYAMASSLLDPWYECKIRAIVNSNYLHIQFRNEEKLLTTKEVAYFETSSVQFPMGSRVIAKFSETDNQALINYYAGVIAEPPKLLNKFRYMVFFDNGNARYLEHQNIRLVVYKSKNVSNDVQANCQKFIQSYLKKYPDRHMIRIKIDRFVRVKLNGKWMVAKVTEVDASMIKVYFTDLNKSEWLYRGSLRFWDIFEKQNESRKGIRSRQSRPPCLNKSFHKYSNEENSKAVKIVETVENSERIINSKSISYTGRKTNSEIEKKNKMLEHNGRSSRAITGIARKSTAMKKSKKINETSLMPRYNCNITYKTIPITAPKPRKFKVHTCNYDCVAWTQYNYYDTSELGILSIPFYYGYERYIAYFQNGNSNNVESKCVMYKTPCGRTIRNVIEMCKYLVVTENQLTIDHFDFSTWVEPLAEYEVFDCVKFINDISGGKEFKPITCVNTINDIIPPPMEYITNRQAMSGVNINVDSDFLCGCDCTDNCQDKTKCACWQMTFEGQKGLPNLYNDSNIGYNFRRLPEVGHVLTGIYECNKTCKCNTSCMNRVVQQPLSQNLQLFMTEKKGWGVRCLNDIPQGSFICNFVGSLLTENDANEAGINFGDEYLAELDYIEVVEKFKENYESEVCLGSLCFPEDNSNDYKTDKIGKTSEFSDEKFQETPVVSNSSLTKNKYKEKLDHKKKHVHKPSKVNVCNSPVPVKSTREHFGDNESVYIMNAKTCGNIGRYINHSCTPNTFVQNVFVDTHDIRFPWVSFFALHYIKAGTELTWDYNYKVGSVPGKIMMCHCETSNCRGRLL